MSEEGKKIAPNRWQMRYIVPLLIKPSGQRIITRDGMRGNLIGYSDRANQFGYLIDLDTGERCIVYATDVDLDLLSDSG
jgi:hypothetical protein